MKKKQEHELDRLAQKQHGAGRISNMQISFRIFAVFGLAALSGVLSFVLMLLSIYRAEKQTKSEIETMVVASAEQYINASIENITAIAQNLYSNASLSSFLNQRYSSSAAYYDAYFQLRSNNSLSVAENRSISKFYIYTDNETILRGGDIYPVAAVQDEEWYKYFTSLRKNMILYCDGKEHRLSLIQKLDYIKYVDGASGEAYLKIDFNTGMLESYFDSLNFDGSLYVLSGGVVLYSNQEDDPENIRITPDYYCVFKNYYAVELEYYAAANQRSLLQVIRGEIGSILSFLAFFAAALVIAVMFCYDLTSRLKKVSKAYEKGDLSLLRARAYATDEVGRISEICVSMTDRMELIQRENKKYSSLLEKTRTAAYALLMDALNQDAGLRFTAYFRDVPEASQITFTHDAFSQPAPLTKELDAISLLLPQRAHFGGLQCAELPENLCILPCSILLTAEDLMRQMLEGTDARLLIQVRMAKHLDCLDVHFSAALNVSASSTLRRSIIRLQAAFEDRPEQTDFTYEPMHPFNTCIRIKQYYGAAVRLLTDDSDTLSLTLRFDSHKLLH